MKKKYVAGELDAARTRFTPNSNRESSNAAPAGREHEDLEYTCILISEQFVYINVSSLQYKICQNKQKLCSRCAG
jgi:hypothetical protein